MNTSGRFLKQLASGLAVIGALSVPVKANESDGHSTRPSEQITHAQPFLYGYTDQNGGVFLYGTNVEGFGSHCGEHPLVGCVPIIDRNQNVLGYQHFTGQVGYVCHLGRREVSPYTHAGDLKPPETLYYPCPEFVESHRCADPHFVGLPTAYTQPQIQSRSREFYVEEKVVLDTSVKTWERMPQDAHFSIHRGNVYSLIATSANVDGNPGWCSDVFNNPNAETTPQTCTASGNPMERGRILDDVRSHYDEVEGGAKGCSDFPPYFWNLNNSPVVPSRTVWGSGIHQQDFVAEGEGRITIGMPDRFGDLKGNSGCFRVRVIEKTFR